MIRYIVYIELDSQRLHRNPKYIDPQVISVLQGIIKGIY